MEKLKYILFSDEEVSKVSGEICNELEHISEEEFKQKLYSGDWEELELKDRQKKLTSVLGEVLPDDFPAALKILEKVSGKNVGFVYLAYSDFVAVYGMDYPAISIPALEKFTSLCSSEFAVRPFIQKYPELMMDTMLNWAESEDHHVRRLASEGCRPRLPWGVVLKEFVKNPLPVMPILEKLLFDDEEYVRKSVANNLNDISKDHPKVFIEFLKKWKGKSDTSDWILKHASRTMLKAGNPDVLKLHGFDTPEHVDVKVLDYDKSAKMGETLKFNFELFTDKEKLGKLRIEYKMYFVRARGKTGSKVFQISEGNINTSVKKISKTYSFKAITTRTYYPGKHKVELLVNGIVKGTFEFKLTL